MNDIVRQERECGDNAPYASSILSLIERAQGDPNTDIEKMERLFALYERAQERNSISAFNEALSEMQPQLPVITERGKIIIPDRNDKTKIIQETPYALWEDINEAIRPLLHKYGFALTFKSGTAPDGKLVVTGILKHRLGHQEEASLPLPHDSSGSKNAVQAIGSSLSYGKRYTTIELLNITTKGDDDDGETAAPSVVHEKANDSPFPQGPARNKTELKKMGRDLWRDVEGCGDADMLDILLSDNASLVDQLKEALPSWWSGYEKGGDQHEGLGAIITRQRESFSENIVNTYRAG